MEFFTEGISSTTPEKWRPLEGSVCIYWEVASREGARAYYRSPDPRFLVFFDDVSSSIAATNDNRDVDRGYRPLARAVYVPAGTPLWTQSRAAHQFSHLDLHVHKDQMLKILAPAVGTSAAMTIIREPVEIQDIGNLETLARLLAQEIANPEKHAVHAESLVRSVITGIVEIPEPGNESRNGRLTQAQMKKLISRFKEHPHARMSVSDMARTVGLSESWFTSVFKSTTNKTPLQWQRHWRISRAQDLLLDEHLTVADIATQLGFYDQAHFTRVFGQVAGDTPGNWRRIRRAMDRMDQSDTNQ